MNPVKKNAEYLARAIDSGQLSEVVWAVSSPDNSGHESGQLRQLVVDLLLTRLAQTPENLACIKLLGFVFAQSGLYGAAIACYTRAIALSPMELDSYRSKSAVLELLLAEKNTKARGSSLMHAASGTSSRLNSNDDRTTVIVLCAGDAAGWSGFQGVQHKQLINIDGQMLLDRTLSQIKQQNPSEVIVAVKQGESSVFKPVCGDGVKIVELEPRRKAWETPAWKYLSSCFYWGASGRTVCLLGDVWFSDNAMSRIFTFPQDEWTAYGRSDASRFTGYPSPNFFGLSFADPRQHEKNLVLLDRLYRARICDAPDGGWALSQLMRNDDPNSRTPGDNFEEIDDFTDDFDTTEDWCRWMEHYSKAQV